MDTNPFGHYYYSKWERYILTKVGIMSSWFSYNRLVKSIAKGATKTDYAYENLYNSVSKLSKKETVKFKFPVLLLIGDSDNTGDVKKYNRK